MSAREIAAIGRGRTQDGGAFLLRQNQLVRTDAMLQQAQGAYRQSGHRKKCASWAYPPRMFARRGLQSFFLAARPGR